MKRIISIISILSLICLTACTNLNFDRNEHVTNVLNNRYNDTFEVIDTYSDGSFICHSSSYPDAIFRASDTGKDIHENYCARVITDKFEKLLSDNVNLEDNDFEIEVYTLIDSLDVINPDISIDSYIRDHETMIYKVNIYIVPNGSTRDYFGNVESMFSNCANINAIVNIYILDSSTIYYVRKYNSHNDKHYDDFSKWFSYTQKDTYTYSNGKWKSDDTF